ncbi:hypothetical protein [Streptomyces sp. NBC_01217]|uniref:hypothetical protein n=1 Tax=Streptomyces sp. NBC_01217 TaxID=2903779 RepID=UPI002E124D2C|nr:DUF6153 family protein [Streptomyces sp. NBC_01217]
MAARLLFVVVLALGVFVMHTVGHPAEGSGAGTSSSMHTVGMGERSVHGRQVDAVTDTGPLHDLPATNPYAGPARTSAAVSSNEPGTDMDMASLCLAVLGTWALAALLRAVFMGRRDWFAKLVTGVLAAVSPNSPPGAPDLAQLSILRI